MLVSKSAVATEALVSCSPTSFTLCLFPHTLLLGFSVRKGSGIENVYRIETLASPRVSPNLLSLLGSVSLRDDPSLSSSPIHLIDLGDLLAQDLP